MLPKTARQKFLENFVKDLPLTELTLETPLKSIK